MITILNNLLNTKGRSSKTGRPSITKRMLLLSTLVSGLTLSAQAQLEEASYLYEKYSMKHYATSQQIKGDGYAMAGTIFDYNGVPGNGGIHLLVDPSPFTTSVVYDNKDYDERLVGLHYFTPEDIVMVTSLGNFTGRGPGNGMQVLRHPHCKRQLIFGPRGSDYWPMGSLMDAKNKMLYICGYVTAAQRAGISPDYTTAKQAFVLKYDLGSSSVVDVHVYNWAGNSPLRRDYDMAHRMKFLKDGNIWVGGLCNGAKESAMMNMVIDPSLNLVNDKPLNTCFVDEGHLAASFDISDDLNGKGYSYIFGNYFYPKSTRVGMYPQPGNYSITAVEAGTLEPVAGAKSHAYFSPFSNAWGTNIVYGNKDNSVILSGYQDGEKCDSPLPSTVDNVNPFLTEAELDAAGGDIIINHTQWSTMLSAVGTGNTSNTNSFYDLGTGLSNLVFGPITTVRDLYGTTDEIVLNAPIWSKPTDKDLNIKYIRANRYLDPKCEIYKCFPDYKYCDTKISEKARERRFDYIIEGSEICMEDLKPKILDCANDGYFKGANTAAVATVGNTTEALVATVYPNPAHDMIQVRLSGTIDAAASVTVQLSDITGKQLSVLYNGTASGMNASLKLPGLLPNGLYTVTVTYNGSKLKSAPLVIN
jgi:hypothetical protein